MPPTLIERFLEKCPFVLRGAAARYSIDFFRRTGALYDSGFNFKDLKEDAVYPMKNFIDLFPTNKKGNRHSLKLIKDGEAAELALRMYQRVYGGTQPDNGEFATSFIRGLALYYQCNMGVNWAAHGAAIARQRARNPAKNPQKLTPPCFREQIQAMIDEFAIALGAANIRGKQAETLSSDFAKNTMEDVLQDWQRLGTHILALRKLLEVVESAKSRDKQDKATHEAKEGKLWDHLAYLRGLCRETNVTTQEKEQLAAEARATAAYANNASVVVEALASTMAASVAIIQGLREQVKTSEKAFHATSTEIHDLAISSSCLRPQAVFDKKPPKPPNAAPMEQAHPCALCSSFWIELAQVNLPYCCLFHPHCMFAVALSKSPDCPSCRTTIRRGGRASGGFHSMKKPGRPPLQRSDRARTHLAGQWLPESRLLRCS